MEANIRDNEFNAEHKRKNSECAADYSRKPRSSSFKDSDKFVYRGGTYYKAESDSFDSPTVSRTGSASGMPDFRNVVKDQLQRTKDEMPKGLMREVMETYKPHTLTRR